MLTPPTDSLYKFMAIFGLVALLWGATFPSQQDGEYRVKEAELRAALPTLDMKSAAIDVRYKELVKEQESELKKMANDSGPSKKWLELQNQKLLLHIQLLEASGQVAITQAKVAVLQEQEAKYQLFGKGAVGFGLLLAVAGFVLWYLKIQRHLDDQIDKSEAESKSPRSDAESN